MSLDNIQWLMILVSLTLIGFIVHLIRRQRLYERYAIIWLFVSLGMLFFSVFRLEINRIADWFGVYYPPSLILAFVVVALVLVGLHFSLVLTRVKRDQSRLVQELALLQEKVAKLERLSDEESDPRKKEE